MTPAELFDRVSLRRRSSGDLFLDGYRAAVGYRIGRADPPWYPPDPDMVFARGVLAGFYAVEFGIDLSDGKA